MLFVKVCLKMNDKPNNENKKIRKSDYVHTLKRATKIINRIYVCLFLSSEIICLGLSTFDAQVFVALPKNKIC